MKYSKNRFYIVGLSLLVLSGCFLKNENTSITEIRISIIDKISLKKYNEYNCKIKKNQKDSILTFEYRAYESNIIYLDYKLDFTDQYIMLDNVNLVYKDRMEIRLGNKNMWLEKYTYSAENRDLLMTIYLTREEGLYLVKDEVNYNVFKKWNNDEYYFIKAIEDIENNVRLDTRKGNIFKNQLEDTLL